MSGIRSTEIGRLTGFSVDAAEDNGPALVTLRLTLGDFFFLAEPQMLRALADRIENAIPDDQTEK